MYVNKPKSMHLYANEMSEHNYMRMHVSLIPDNVMEIYIIKRIYDTTRNGYIN